MADLISERSSSISCERSSTVSFCKTYHLLLFLTRSVFNNRVLYFGVDLSIIKPPYSIIKKSDYAAAFHFPEAFGRDHNVGGGVVRVDKVGAKKVAVQFA